MERQALPFLDLDAPGFSTKGPEVIAARAQHWAARTRFGLAILRHRQAGQLLRDRRLRQGSHAWPRHVGLEGSFADFWEASIIGQEGDPHRRLRQLAVPALSAEFIDSLRPAFDRIAADITDRYVAAGGGEFMKNFSTEFAGRVICAFLAIDEDEWLQVASDASALGLAMGIGAKSFEPKFNAACDRLMDRATGLIERARSIGDPAGYVGRLVQRAEELGDIDDDALQNLIVISIFGGVDTTRAQLAFLVALFIAHPDQWQHLRANPDLAAATVEEAIRQHPTTTWSSREAVEDFEFDGVTFKAGETVHVLVHATATDPMVTEGSDFDITAKRRIHFGFGGGAHNCLGQAVARADIACALRAMAARIGGFAYSGTPKWLPDSGNTSPISLPVSVTPV